MPTTRVNIAKVAALAVTRMALGVGVGLLVAEQLEPAKRRKVGSVLLAVGLVTTGPLVFSMVRGIETHEPV
jgi:hypothetical protein